ncbi:MAG TPA: hypothetical protein VEW68_09840 [Patescibacteria group bacterium]|nr:hypothetical protein [Patescibacteria group bacterium]
MLCASARSHAAALVAACAAAGLLAACGTPVSATSPYPPAGLVLLGLGDGAVRGSAVVGSDPVAVLVSEDGRTAYVADSSPGDVYAVRIPELSVAWRQHVGGAPFGLLLHDGNLLVSLFETPTVAELDPATGRLLAMHSVCGEPAVMTVDPRDGVLVACRQGAAGRLDGTSVAAGEGFGIAVSGGVVWTAGYSRSELVPVSSGGPVALPAPVSPFWRAAGSGATLLVAAEGHDEDGDPGAVLSYDPMSGTFRTLATPRDPDQVLQSGQSIFVAAHGDRDVLAIDGASVSRWAMGAAAVGLSADPRLNLLVVAVNAHE